MTAILSLKSKQLRQTSQAKPSSKFPRAWGLSRLNWVALISDRLVLEKRHAAMSDGAFFMV
jgi:hypothetical protein